MSKIERATASIFGESAGFQEIGVFGSLQAGSPAYSTNPETIQSLANWVGGWVDAVIGGNSPAIEDMNGFCYVMAYQIAYLLQAGIQEYDSATPYYKGSVVNVPIVIFTVTSANATVGATFTNNGATFTVLQTIAAGTRLVCYSATGAPAVSGTLTKSAGTGDATITFSAFTDYTALYTSISDTNTGNAVTNATYWSPLMPAVGKPYQRIASNAAGAGNEYSWNSISAQVADASLTVPSGYNLNVGFLTVPVGVTYLIAGSIVCMGPTTVLGTMTVTGFGVCL